MELLRAAWCSVTMLSQLKPGYAGVQEMDFLEPQNGSRQSIFDVQSTVERHAEFCMSDFSSGMEASYEDDHAVDVIGRHRDRANEHS